MKEENEIKSGNESVVIKDIKDIKSGNESTFTGHTAGSSGNITAHSGNTGNVTGITTGTTTGNLWSNPVFLEAREVGESVEFLYKQTSMITYSVYPSPPPEERIFKIVYSCVDGKWHKSEPIFGKIIPAQNEYYEFED